MASATRSVAFRQRFLPQPKPSYRLVGLRRDGKVRQAASLRRLSGRHVCRILERHGFAEVRSRGSHVIMQSSSPNGTVTVPVPDHREMRVGTLMSIIRQSGVHRVEFEEGA